MQQPWFSAMVLYKTGAEVDTWYPNTQIEAGGLVAESTPPIHP